MPKNTALAEDARPQPISDADARFDQKPDYRGLARAGTSDPSARHRTMARRLDDRPASHTDSKLELI